MRRIVRHATGLGAPAALLAPMACATLDWATPPAAARFDLLWEQKLSAFEQRVTVDRRLRADEPWTRVAEAWLSLSTCGSIAPLPRPDGDPLARLLYATLELEETRRLALAAGHRRTAEAAWEHTLFADLADPDFGERDPVAATGRLIRWPNEAEAWPDELPAQVPVRPRCGERGADPPALGPEDWTRAELDAVDRALAAAADLPPATRRGAIAALVARLHLHGARRAFAAARACAGWGRTDDRGYWEGRADGYLRRSPAGEWTLLSAAEQAEAEQLRGLVAVAAGDVATAEAALARAEALGLDGESRWCARYLRLRAANERGAWPAAIALADPLPPPASPYHTPTLYRLGEAFAGAGADDRLLALAKRAFSDRAWRDDPFLRALFWRVLDLLAGHSFTPKTIELLEELGPRRETWDRVAELARRYLDFGRAADAAAAASFLLESDPDARRHPRYHSLTAFAAFLRDERDSFRRAVDRLTHRDAAVTEAIPAWRRAGFYSAADTELARLLREMLPLMAEWGDTAGARGRRERWLTEIVERAQAFLRRPEQSVVHEDLLALYRVASALLREHPRGYAQRVGEVQPTPLVLGMVRLDPQGLLAHEPAPATPAHEPYMLTLIPRDRLPPAEWTAAWAPPPAGAHRGPTGGGDDA